MCIYLLKSISTSNYYPLCPLLETTSFSISLLLSIARCRCCWHPRQIMDCCSDELEVNSKKGRQELKARRNSAGADDRREGREDTATVDMVKRRRGRPPGSKNKPKPPRPAIASAAAAAPAPPCFPSSSGGMRAHVLEIPAGHDVAAALAAFSRRHGLGICVLGGTGAVANVSLRQPSHSGSSTFSLRGRFDVLSISATFLPPALSAAVASAGANELKVCLSGQQGQVLGGTVAGPMVAAGTLVVVVAVFSDPTVHQLPGELEEEEEGGGRIGGGIDNRTGATAEAEPRQDEEDDDNDEEENVEADEGPASEHQYQQNNNYFYDHHHNGGPPGGFSIYGGHFTSDVLWQSSHHPTSPPY